ncbi:MAG: hypothetical protein KDA84_29085, partial [Planctomycetaceae bacterium]|nr:hypothetical protein [Planctomycetaceae bacterium]
MSFGGQADIILNTGWMQWVATYRIPKRMAGVLRVLLFPHAGPSTGPILRKKQMLPRSYLVITDTELFVDFSDGQIRPWEECQSPAIECDPQGFENLDVPESIIREHLDWYLQLHNNEAENFDPRRDPIELWGLVRNAFHFRESSEA